MTTALNDESISSLHALDDQAPILRLVSPTVASTVTEADVCETVALHVATISLPDTASLTDRERVRGNWQTALRAIMNVDGHPGWALAYLPGVHHGDNETYAVHIPTGRVFGGECDTTSQRTRESTNAWLGRLHDGLENVFASYSPRYVARHDLV